MSLERGLAGLGKDARSIRDDLKSADWKVMLAAVMKQYTSATNVWITEQLNMGIPQIVSQNLGKFHQSGADAEKAYQDLIIRITE